MSRTRLSARVAARALATLLLGGCVYYNGMYNAKRLAGSARKAEREGRTFEANNLWGQVIIRAESLVVRHPRSKYVDEAMVLKGIALARLGQCSNAVRPLARVSVIQADGDTGEEAALALGRCQLQLGDPVAAELAFTQVLESRDPVRRREARLYHARALRQTGRPDEAVGALAELTGPSVSEERLLAYGASGREGEMLALADSLLARNDSARTWDSVVTTVGRANPRAASVLVDHIAKGRDVPPAVQARRLYEDAERLEPVDSARALARLKQAAGTRAETDHGARGRLELLRQDVQRVTAPPELAGVSDSLERLGAGGTPSAQEAKLLARTIARVRAAVDSSEPWMAQGDLRLFLAAETSRDSLQAPALAASMFRRLVETWPESPYAPKALLAGRVLDPEWGETTRSLLEERYAGSPYLAFLRGEDLSGYRELEDSLQTFAFGMAAAQRRPVQPTPDQPTGTVRRVPSERQPTTRPGLEP